MLKSTGDHTSQTFYQAYMHSWAFDTPKIHCGMSAFLVFFFSCPCAGCPTVIHFICSKVILFHLCYKLNYLHYSDSFYLQFSNSACPQWNIVFKSHFTFAVWGFELIGLSLLFKHHQARISDCCYCLLPIADVQIWLTWFFDRLYLFIWTTRAVIVWDQRSE